LIDGGAGNDTLYGSPGTDTLLGRDGIDVFDFQNNDFADPEDFSSGTLQILNGGVNPDEADDLLKLPRSPGDFRYHVDFGSNWETTTTTVQKLNANGSVEYAFTTKDIERVDVLITFSLSSSRSRLS
jgi:Ca2+-binding RTX toxin-like protein